MQKEDRKNRTSRLRGIELGIWLIILGLVFVISTFAIIKYHDSYESHRIFLPDVYGLIVGSPVNLMGVTIGHVTKTKIIKEDIILVKFKITNRSVHIPKGTLATVEMYGLGGSKSLELYPPDSNKMVNEQLLVGGNDYFLVEQPKRLRDAWSLLYQMYKTLMNIIYAVTNFGVEMSQVDKSSISNDYNESVKFINYSNTWLDNSAKNMENFRTILEKVKK